MKAKLESICLHGTAPTGAKSEIVTCACSYDDPSHVCLSHSPQLAKALAKLAELETDNERLREAFQESNTLNMEYAAKEYARALSAPANAEAKAKGGCDVSNEDMRKQFEAWVSGPPYKGNIERWPLNHGYWPGEYKHKYVSITWHAWQTAVAAEREACAKVCELEKQERSECPEMAQYCADAIRERSEKGGGE